MELVSYRMPWQPIPIMPVGDIQWSGNDAEVVIGKLARHIQWGVEQGAWFIGMGDYVDTHSPSNRKALRAAALYDSTEDVALDMGPRMLIDELFEKALKPSVGRWLGLLAGHHWSQFADGTTTDQRLAGLLKTRFLGDCAYVRLQFATKGQARGGSSNSVLIWAHHGTGSGVSVGSPISKLERLPASWAGDIFLIGHQSKLVTTPVDRIVPTFATRPGAQHGLRHETVLLVGTGGFLKGYAAGRKRGHVPTGSYVEKEMMRPVALGGALITVRPRLIDGRWSPDLRVSL